MRQLELDVDAALVKKLLIRLMTRNERDAGKRTLDRATLEGNFHTLNQEPQAHLAFVMQMMDKAAQEKKEPAFEAGLVFGVTMTLATRSLAGRQMLKRMIQDIEFQQKLADDDAVKAEHAQKIEMPENVKSLDEVRAEISEEKSCQ